MKLTMMNKSYVTQKGGVKLSFPIEELLLWFFFFLGILLFLNALRKPPRKAWIAAFTFTGFLASILGVIAVESHMIAYPVSLFESYFDTSPLYEFLLVPTVSVYVYKTTYHSDWCGILVQCLIYTACLTIAEIFIERFTDLVHYIRWAWPYTFISVFLVLFSIRMVFYLIDQWESRKR
jgi:hypothetical protein